MARFRFMTGPYNSTTLLPDEVLTANGYPLLKYVYRETCPDTVPLEDEIAEAILVEDIVLEQEPEVEISSTHSDGTHARRFVDLLNGGKTAAEAANRMGFRLKDLALNGEFQERVKERLINGFIPDEIRRALVKASLNTVLMDSMNSPETYKLALEATKQIAQDPEVGLNLPPQPSVVVNIGDLESLLKKVDPSLE